MNEQDGYLIGVVGFDKKDVPPERFKKGSRLPEAAASVLFIKAFIVQIRYDAGHPAI